MLLIIKKVPKGDDHGSLVFVQELFLVIKYIHLNVFLKDSF